MSGEIVDCPLQNSSFRLLEYLTLLLFILLFAYPGLCNYIFLSNLTFSHIICILQIAAFLLFSIISFSVPLLENLLVFNGKSRGFL